MVLSPHGLSVSQSESSDSLGDCHLLFNWGLNTKAWLIQATQEPPLSALWPHTVPHPPSGKVLGPQPSQNPEVSSFQGVRHSGWESQNGTGRGSSEICELKGQSASSNPLTCDGEAGRGNCSAQSLWE